MKDFSNEIKYAIYEDLDSGFKPGTWIHKKNIAEVVRFCNNSFLGSGSQKGDFTIWNTGKAIESAYNGHLLIKRDQVNA